jgi:dihydropteroate synthase
LEVSAKRNRHLLKLHDGRVIRFPAVMGILNITPDSFSDGGRYLDADRAVDHALEMEAAGAAIIDIGGESTRPYGAREVPADVELARIMPVLRRLGGRLRAPISIDTRKAVVAERTLDAGATIVNDVSALGSDPAMAPLLAKRRCAVVLMHMRGDVATHIRYARYRNVVREVEQGLAKRAREAIAAGISASRIILDPGLGFSKMPLHSLSLLAALPRLCALGYPILVGASRKGFLRRVAGSDSAALEAASVAVSAIAIASGAAVVRMHDVAPTVAAAKVALGIKSSQVF